MSDVRDKRRIFVAGATGAVGRAVAHRAAELLRADETLILLGRDKEKLRNLASKLPPVAGTVRCETLSLMVPGSVDSFKADERCTMNLSSLDNLLSPAESMGRTDVFLNAIGPSSRVTVPLARHVIGKGAHFIDVGGSQRIIDEIDPWAESHGVVALFGAGVQPGLTGTLLNQVAGLLARPQGAAVKMYVGGRQRLTAGALEEYVDSFEKDGGWPGTVWVRGEFCRAGESATTVSCSVEDGLGEWVNAPTAEVSVHLDEEYVDVARAWGLGEIVSMNVMDEPSTADLMRKFIAGEATVDDVERKMAEEIEDPYFKILVTASDSDVQVKGTFSCRDSYRASGMLAAELAAQFAHTPVERLTPGAGWACRHQAAQCWFQHSGVDVSLVLPRKERDGAADVSVAEPRVERKSNISDGAVVVGAGFGAHYALALAQPASPVPLSAIVGQGGAAGRRLAGKLGVAYITSRPGATLSELSGFPHVAKLAVVAVRGELAGGQGDQLASQLLDSGISVLQELPVDPSTVATQLRRARRMSTTFHVTGFYEHTAPVRSLIEAVAHLRAHTTITYVHLRTCYQMLDRAGLLLSILLNAVPVGSVQIAPAASDEWKLVSGRWGQIPVDIMLAHRMDPKDPDNHSQPMASIVVETPEGELSWRGPASAPRWQQRPHSVGSQLTVPQGKLDEPWCKDIIRQWPNTWGDVVDDAWTEGVHRAVAQVRKAQQDEGRAEYLAGARRTLLVLRWWKEVTGALPAPKVISSTGPQLIDRPRTQNENQVVP